MQYDDCEKIVIRSPRSKQERLFVALNSTDDDLYEEDDCTVVITGRNKEGEILYLGEISGDAFYRKGVNPREIIDKIRFSGV